MSGAIKMEAMRLSKNMIKGEMKRQGIPISYASATEITRAAKAFLDQSPWILEKAKCNLEAAHANPIILKAETQG